MTQRSSQLENTCVYFNSNDICQEDSASNFFVLLLATPQASAQLYHQEQRITRRRTDPTGYMSLASYMMFDINIQIIRIAIAMHETFPISFVFWAGALIIMRSYKLVYYKTIIFMHTFRNL